MRSSRRVLVVVVSVTLLILGVQGVDNRREAVAADAPKQDKAFDQTIQPFLTKYCNTCHNSEKNAGGVALDTYQSEAHARKDRKVWEMIGRVIADGEMPPKRSKTQPSKDEKTAVTGWIENSLLAADCFGPRDPGRVTLRRLNRSEYNNTIRDLCGINFNPADDFPSDDVGYGFDHIGDVLSVQPVLIEKYMAAADRILEQGIGSLGRVKPELRKYNPFTLSATPRSAKLRETNEKGKEVRRIVLTEDGAAFLEKVNFPGDGEYSFKITAWGTTVGKDKTKLVLRVDGKDISSFTVEAERAKPTTLTASAKFTAGEKRVAMAFANPFTDQATGTKRTLGIEGLEIDGPIGGSALPVSDSMKRIVTVLPKTDTDNEKAAEASLQDFARRAFRRPPTADEITRLMKLYRTAVGQGDPFEQAIKLPIKAILVSPHFLFRVEADPKEPDQVRTLNEFELATRLAYFLWSSTPDETLYRLAEKNELRKPGVLPAQIKRMLADPKAAALTQNFAGQWLMLRNILNLSPDNGTFKTWDESLRQAIIRETELFFEHVVREDRSVLEFLDANYTFLNDRLSWHYGIGGVKGSEFRKVELKDRRRGGLVTQASILLVTSNPTRTSPVKRGKWVYENILGLTPPPAAPDVPELEKTELKGSLRQRMEQHRSNPACAGCHAKLDPLGFGLENFDGIGKWRDTDDGFKVDASGILPDGSTFNGPAELRKVLLGKADMFRRCLAEKLLTYALGRGLDYPDKCVLDDLVKKLKSGNDTFSALVSGIVDTDAFQKRRGKRSE